MENMRTKVIDGNGRKKWHGLRKGDGLLSVIHVWGGGGLLWMGRRIHTFISQYWGFPIDIVGSLRHRWLIGLEGDEASNQNPVLQIKTPLLE